MVEVDLEAAVCVETPTLQRPQNAYLAPSSGSEQVEPIHLTELPQMASGLRNRHPAEPSAPAVVTNEVGPESRQMPTTSSSEGGRQTPEAPAFASLVRTASKGFRTLVTTGSWTTQAEKDARQLIETRGHHNLKYDKVDDFPRGFPQLAAFVNSDDTFANFRRFGRLSARILLHIQNDLNDLEQKLDNLDKQDDQDDTMRLRLGGFEEFTGQDEEQRQLRKEIQKKYVEYADILLKDANLRALEKTPARNHMANFRWMENEGALAEERHDFLNHPDDFISLSRHNDRRFEDFIESWLDRQGPDFFMKRILKTHEEHRKTDEGRLVDYYSKDRLALFAILLQVCLVAVLFLVPVFLLFLVPMSRAVMAVTASTFLLAFTVIISLWTGAKVQEVFFGTAAYAAVIIMFLGNINQSGLVQTD